MGEKLRWYYYTLPTVVDTNVFDIFYITSSPILEKKVPLSHFVINVLSESNEHFFLNHFTLKNYWPDSIRFEYRLLLLLLLIRKCYRY